MNGRRLHNNLNKENYHIHQYHLHSIGLTEILPNSGQIKHGWILVDLDFQLVPNFVETTKLHNNSTKITNIY